MGTESDRTRASIRSSLADALSQAADGRGRLALLQGEAGIGKTTTAQELAAAARRQGMAVRWSACWSGGATVAHAPWLTLLSGLGAPGRQAMDALLGSDAVDQTAASARRASAYAIVVGSLEAATADGPVLLVLDDLHWADEGTLQLLDVVAAHLPGLAALVVGTYRDTDVAPGSPLTRLGGRADRIPLRGLDREGVAQLLAREVGPDRASSLAAEVRDLTGGNPFLVIQLGRLLAEDPDRPPGVALPGGARDLLEQRLAALADDDLGLLRNAAILGSPFREVDLAVLADRPEHDVAATLERATTARIVEPRAGVWAFVHDLFRQAALAGLDPADVAVLHRTAASILQRDDPEPALIAAHLLAAGAEAAEPAASWSIRAGDRALAAMAWEEAAGHHERALSALRPGVRLDLRALALEGLGRARLLTGDEAGAARAFGELAALGRAGADPDLVARAALGFSADRAGFEVRLFDQRQIDLLAEAAALLDEDRDPSLAALVAARLSVALSMSAGDDQRRALAERAVALARRSGDPTVLGRALAAHCDATAGPGQVLAREAEATEIIAIAEAAGDGPLELLGRRLRFVARLEAGALAGVEEDRAAFARRADAIGNPLYSWYVPLWAAQAAVVAGDTARADRLAAEVEVLGRAGGSTNAAMLATVLRLTTLQQRGAYVEAIEAAEALGDVAPELVDHITSAGSFAWAYVLAGRPERARAILDRATSIGLDRLPVDAEWLPNLTNLIRATAALDHPLLPDALERLEPFAHLVSFEGIGAGLYGSVARFAAIGCIALGRHDDALRYAARAVEVNRGFGGTLAGDALRTLAYATAAAGGDGARLHAEADAVYRSVGAAHLARPGPNGGRTGADPVPPPARSTAEPSGSEPAAHRLRRDGDVWHVTYGGVTSIIKHSKGLADLAVLLDRPGQELHVTELEGIPSALAGGDGGEALDRRAIAAYRERLVELAEEVDDADLAHDLGRAERARVEYDVLVEQLAGAVGLGGRVRAAGPEPVERLRKAVSARVRDAIRRLDGLNPVLGRHLANSVRTGIFCAYRPEVPTTWICQTRSGAPEA